SFFTTKKTNIKVFGKDGPSVVQVTSKPGEYSRDAIKRKVDELSQSMRDQDVSIQVSLRYNEGWRTGIFTNVGEPIQLYRYRHHGDSGIDMDDPDKYRQFIVYVKPNTKNPLKLKGKARGGCSRLND